MTFADPQNFSVKRSVTDVTHGMGATVLLIFAVLVVSTVFQVLDPLIRHDDYPVFFEDVQGYYGKTLTEGRWVNYLWHMRGYTPPASVLFLIYLACWAIYLGSLVHLAFQAGTDMWRRVAVAVIAALCAPSVLISFWYVTLIPGMALLAAYGLVTVFLPERTSRWLLLVFVPVGLMAYTTYPLYMLALVLLRADRERSLRDLASVVGLFMASFVVGMLTIFTLNWIYHGVFGVPMADWRNPNPATDLASLIANLDQVGAFLKLVLDRASFGMPPVAYVQLALLFFAAWKLWPSQRGFVVYAYVGIGLGLGLILVQTLKSGIFLPPRAAGYAWVYFAVLLGQMSLAMHAHCRKSGRMGDNLVRFVMLSLMIFSGLLYFDKTQWSRLSRSMAVELSQGVEGGAPSTGPVYITGTYLSQQPAMKAGVQHALGISYRFRQLTERQIIHCEVTPDLCADLEPALRDGVDGTDWEVVNMPDFSVLRLGTEVLREPLLPHS